MIRLNVMKSTVSGAASVNKGLQRAQFRQRTSPPGSYTVTFSSCQIHLLSFSVFQPGPDTAITQHWHNWDIFAVFGPFVWTIHAGGHLLAGILSLCDTPEELHGLGNVSRDSSSVVRTRSGLVLEQVFLYP